MKTKWAVVLVGLFAFALSASRVQAQDSSLDPPVFIGNPTTCPDSTCAPFFNNETVAISNEALTVWDQGAASKTLGGPFVLIVAIPNQVKGSAPGISSVIAGPGVTGTPTGQLGGPDIFTGTWKPATGYVPTQLTSGNAYPLVFPTFNGDGSQNFSNFTGWDAHLGITATTYALFAYTINANLGQSQYVTVDFSGAGLPVGTFAFVYGCQEGQSTAALCSPNGNIFSTPFTHTGIVTTTVPEPGSLALLVSGLMGLGGFLRRRQSLN